jgi:hypothetical protein
MQNCVHATVRQLTALLKRLLDTQGTVHVEGLGTFERGADGELRFTPPSAPRVFIAYVQEDLAAAERLSRDLRAIGCDPWLDRERLVPGQNWPRAIELAIEVSDFFIPLFSRRSVIKRSQFQSELRYALDCARRVPLDEPFVIPVRLDDCRVPNRVANVIQYVDLFPDWEQGMGELAAAMRRCPSLTGPGFSS